MGISGAIEQRSRAVQVRDAVVQVAGLTRFDRAGGRIVVFAGLIDRLQLTDDELAMVLGHEIGHAIAEHAAERLSLQLVTDTALQAAAQRSGTVRTNPSRTTSGWCSRTSPATTSNPRGRCSPRWVTPPGPGDRNS